MVQSQWQTKAISNYKINIRLSSLKLQMQRQKPVINLKVKLKVATRNTNSLE